MISAHLQHQQRSSSKPSQIKHGKLAVSFFIFMLLLHNLPCLAKGDFINRANAKNKVQEPALRGRLKLIPMKDEKFNNIPNSSGRDGIMKEQQSLQSLVGEESQRRSAEANNIPTIFITPSSTFQVIISTLLTILVLLQLYVFTRFLRNRSKRVLEFTQPDAICIFVACSVIATASCYFYIYVSSSFTCAIREPLLFMSVSLMGATVAGRAWRMSTLVNNPLLSAGKNSHSSDVSRIEQSRQQILRIISVLSGFDCSTTTEAFRRRSSNMNESGEEKGRSRPNIRVQVTFAQMLRATFFMILPQLFWQVVVLSTPTLRSSRELVTNDHLNNGYQMMTMEQYQCQSTVGLWPHCVSVFLALCPYAIAYILNIRPKSELDLLPEMIDEKEKLEQSFYMFARVITVSAPVIGLTYANSPEARVYSTICAVLALPLSCCYYIAYLKLNAIKSDIPKQQSHARGTSTAHSKLSRGKEPGDHRSTTSAALRMAEMYLRIGRSEETVQLVDETLGLYHSNAGNRSNAGLHNEQIALGFTKNDLQALNEDKLELIIRLLKLKFYAMQQRFEGASGASKGAQLNIGAIKLFEACPASKTLKDISFMFPIYNLAGQQIKAGVIDDDDEFSLEMDLSTHCHREVQLQAYHYARSLANLAEIYGRLGLLDEAFNYFNIMEAVYIKEEHPKLLTDAYARDRCAICYASSALWYLQKGESSNAIERCNYIIDHILPQYDKSDILGLYMVFVPLIRVLKWNGEAGKALEAYCKFMPDAANTHLPVGNLHKPTILLLQICEGSSHQYNEGLMSDDIESVLSFDVTGQSGSFFTHYGWSMKTLAAELCMLLASRLDTGSASREKLIDRGIRMAKIAQQFMTTSNGKVKHILALEANKDVYTKLLKLANRDADIVEVEDLANRASFSQSQASASVKNLSSSFTSGTSTPSLSSSFADKLKTSTSARKLEGTHQLSECISTPLSDISVPSKPIRLSSMESIGSKRPSSFADKLKTSTSARKLEETHQLSECTSKPLSAISVPSKPLRLSSMESIGSKRPSSLQSCETIEEDTFKHSSLE